MAGLKNGPSAFGAALLLGGAVLVLASSSTACGSSVPLGTFEPGPDGAPPSLAPEAGGPEVDANAFRPLCAATECPIPYGTCSDDSFRCETNFDSDNTSCGACGVECPSGELMRDLFGAEFFCQSGTCKMSCASDSAKHTGDCNNNVADGCEVDLDCDSNNCGACGVKCPAGTNCVGGNCGCPAGLTACGPAGCGLECVDLKLDDTNCGVCGKVCEPGATPPPPNMHVGCDNGACGPLKCDRGFEDCNTNLADGCEVELAGDPANCGSCGKACGAGQVCENGKCSCAPSETRCPGFGTFTYCVDLQSDSQDCGACGNRCPFAEYPSRSVCRLGRCEVQCPAGFADCDGNVANGCETQVRSDPRNCGACGVQCDLALGQPCVEGACLVAPCEGGPSR